jgi:hypothetical protein
VRPAPPPPAFAPVRCAPAGVDLGTQIVDGRLPLRDLGFGLSKRRLIIAVVQAHEGGASVKELIVRHGDIDNRPTDLCADRNDARVNEGIIGGLELAGMQPPGDCRHNQQDQQHCRAGNKPAMSPQSAMRENFASC